MTSTMALVVALGGTGAYAANTIGSSDIKNNSIRSADVKNKEIKSADLASNAVTGAKVKNGTLLADDFKAGTLLRGPAGPAGPAGTPNGYTKAEADAAFLGKTAKAADSAALDGIPANSFVRGHTGTSAINFNANSPKVTLTGIVAPVQGQLQFTITVRCVSFTGTTDTRWDLAPQVDGVNAGGPGGFLSFAHAALASTPVDSTTVIAQVPVAAGNHTVGFNATRSSGDGSADCDINTVTRFIPYKNDGTR